MEIIDSLSTQPDRSVDNSLVLQFEQELAHAVLWSRYEEEGEVVCSKEEKNILYHGIFGLYLSLRDIGKEENAKQILAMTQYDLQEKYRPKPIRRIGRPIGYPQF